VWVTLRWSATKEKIGMVDVSSKDERALTFLCWGGKPNKKKGGVGDASYDHGGKIGRILGKGKVQDGTRPLRDGFELWGLGGGGGDKVYKNQGRKVLRLVNVSMR